MKAKRRYKKNVEMIKRWKQLPSFQACLQQIHADCYAGLKNGEKIGAVKQAMRDFCEDEIINSIICIRPFSP